MAQKRPVYNVAPVNDPAVEALAEYPTTFDPHSQMSLRQRQIVAEGQAQARAQQVYAFKRHYADHLMESAGAAAVAAHARFLASVRQLVRQERPRDEQVCLEPFADAAAQTVGQAQLTGLTTTAIALYGEVNKSPYPLETEPPKPRSRLARWWYGSD